MTNKRKWLCRILLRERAKVLGAYDSWSKGTSPKSAYNQAIRDYVSQEGTFQDQLLDDRTTGASLSRAARKAYNDDPRTLKAVFALIDQGTRIDGDMDRGGT